MSFLLPFKYCKIASSNTSHLEAHVHCKYIRCKNYSFSTYPVSRCNSTVQWIFDLSMFYLRKFFDLRKNFPVPKILLHKMFDLRKISRTPFFDLRKKNQAFWGKKGNFWQKMLKLKSFFFLYNKKTWKNCTWLSYLTINNIQNVLSSKLGHKSIYSTFNLHILRKMVCLI